VASLNLIPSQPDPFIVHPGVVIAMFQLIPSISFPDSQVRKLLFIRLQSITIGALCHPQAEIALKMLVTDIIQSLLRSERNVQILCDAGFPSEILECARRALHDESHYLHTPLLTILERLSCHALEPKDLREFLRMGNPLNCILPEVDPEAAGGLVPLTRVKTLVSMATPRDIGQHGRGTLSLPPFVEFDMQPEGFGCLFLPSIAPQCHTSGMANIGGGAGIVVMGGVGGGGDRVFPAQTGMTFSTWICVDKFSDPRLDPHGVRLLTLVRNIMDREENLICLSVMLSPRDKALLVSTQETPLPKGDSGTSFACSSFGINFSCGSDS
jgi:WD repeat and FYVE domain-containing protein 3